MGKAITACFVLLLISCNGRQGVDVKTITSNYFEGYQKKDLQTWISFYADSAFIYDISTDIKTTGKHNIYEMVKPTFQNKIPLYKNIEWEIDDIITSGLHASVKGRINNAIHNGKVLPPWEFVSWINFNNEGKIIEQFDFVKYPELN